MNAVRVYLVPWVWWQCILSQRVWWQCTLSQQSDDNVSCPMSGDSIYLLSHDCGDSVLSQECGDCVSCPMSVSCPMWRCCPVNVVKVYPVPRVWWQPLLTSRYQGRAFQTPHAFTPLCLKMPFCLKNCDSVLVGHAHRHVAFILFLVAARWLGFCGVFWVFLLHKAFSSFFR